MTEDALLAGLVNNRAELALETVYKNLFWHSKSFTYYTKYNRLKSENKKRTKTSKVRMHNPCAHIGNKDRKNSGLSRSYRVLPTTGLSRMCREIHPGAVNSGCPTSVSKYATSLYLDEYKKRLQCKY